jgi:ribonuclease HI
MELQAVIEGLSALKRATSVLIVTDSQYVMKGVTEWMAGWKEKGWRRGPKKEPVKNAELWQALDKLVSEHDVTWEYVPGHSGHPENERCDELAVAAAEAMR